MFLNDESTPNARKTGTPIDMKRLKLAISAIEEGLRRAKRQINPEAKAELVLMAYGLIKENADENKIIRLVRLVSAA